MHRELGREDTTVAFCDSYHADLQTWLPLWSIIDHQTTPNKKEKNMIYKTLNIKLEIEQHELHYNPEVNTCALEG